MAEFKINGCTVNYLENPCGIDNTPVFSYKMSSALRGDRQVSRRICVTDTLTNEVVWDTGVVETEVQTFIRYEGKALAPLTRYAFTVTAVNTAGETAEASGSFVTGKLSERWTGKWITTQSIRRETDAYAAQYLRKVFSVNKPVKAAHLAIVGLGYFESYINGTKTGDDVLSPAFTQYNAETMYLVYDVADLLQQGDNAIGVVLGNGWYNCFAEDPWNTRAASWKHLPKLLCELRVVYEDGTEERVVSDPTWKANKNGPITFNGIRNGEFYDARLELGNWNDVDYDDSAWEGTKIMKSPGGKIIAMEMEPIRLRATHPAVKKWPFERTVVVNKETGETRTESGWVFDVGQNQAGVGLFKVRGAAGTQVKFRYSDVIKPNGEIDNGAIGCFIRSGEFQTDKYTKKTDGEEIWHPIFTYHGFQYVEVTGIDYEPELGDVTAMTLCTDVADIGVFDCSDELLSRVQHLARWSTISNMHSIPTDCPHREKNGWTGDVSLSSEQMLTNFGTRAFLSKWSQDMRTSQRPAGQIPCVVPSTGWGYYGLMGPDWSSALINVPYNIYVYNGDMDILRKNYDAIKRNCDFMESMTVDYTLSYGTGDWCPPFEGPAIGKNMGSYKCPNEVSDTGFFYNAANLVAKMAKMFGEKEDEIYYSELAAKIKAVFREKFYDAKEVNVMGNCQTATATMLYFNLCEEDEREPLLRRLIKQIEEQDWHLDFGVLGNKFVMHTLGSMGEGNVAHRMLAQRTFPGCQRWIDLGATTLWECWNGGGSHNHHMFSDVSSFMYKYVGGISPDENEPGFVHTILRPSVDCGMESALAKHESMYGNVQCHWTNKDGVLTLDLEVPFGCHATLYLPKHYKDTLTENGTAIAEVGTVGENDKEFFVELVSGKYVLTAK